MIELEEARHAWASARQELSVGDKGGAEIARSILQALRAEFPPEWHFPFLDAALFEVEAFGTFARWEALAEEIDRAINAQIVAHLNGKAAAARTNQKNAKATRKGIFPGWMKDCALHYAKSRAKPSPTLALDAIRTEASERNYTGAFPTPEAVGQWMKRASRGQS